MITALVLVLLAVLNSCSKDGIFPCIRGKGAKKTETRSLSQFTKIEYRLEGNIEVVKGDKFEAAIGGHENQLSEVRTRVSGGKLIIDSERCLKNSDFHVVVTLPHLNSLKLAGSAGAEVEDGFDDDEMEFSIAGSGSITAAAASRDVKAEISGSGNILLIGTAEMLDAQISGSGKIKAFNLQVERLNARISGSGDVESSVSERIDAQISGSGSVRYKGSPGTVNSEISGSGKVVRVD